ncbi:MAG: anti-sigma factor [Xanthomarina sp.]
MNDKINTFLNSDLLEKYLLGNTTSAETEKVEIYLSNYPEVQNAYNVLQENLEIISKSQAIETPNHILNNILNELDKPSVISIKPVRKYRKWYHLSIAACITALIFAGSSFVFFTQNLNLKSENQKIVDEIYDLRNDISLNNNKLNDIMLQFKQLNNPETEKYIITGNYRAKNLKTVAYINPKEKTSMIDVVSLPQLPDEQCYQIWAQVQDNMVSLGILSETDRELKQIPYTENALGLSITIENKGGNQKGTKENSVAEIAILKHN